MILVDTSVWIDHLRRSDPILARILADSLVLGHPFITGELACGSLAHRNEILGALADLPQAVAADDPEVLRLIEARGLAGLGIGYLDAHLLASAALTPGARLWTRDRRLALAASRLDLAATQDRFTS